MDVTFNVPNAGPLTAVSLHLLSFRTAVHLATGAYGWWKAKERTRSLSECLAANKAALVGTTSFNSLQYKETRRQGFIQGLVVEEGRLRNVQGHIETTAVLDDFGKDCLRAITTGLLCFYGVASTVTILSDTVPFGLVQTEQDDGNLDFSGSNLTSLAEFVTAVATEEDCNTFRRHLLQQASDYQNALQGSTIQNILKCNPVGEQDLHLIIGLLRWMVLPKYRRLTQNYPTRSLRVWHVAVVMRELGFELNVAQECVTSTSDYALLVSDTQGLGEFFDVILVTASVGPTDHMMLHGMPIQSVEVRPQTTTLGGLPYASFSCLRESYSRTELEYLVEIWKTSFQSATKEVQLPMINVSRLVTLVAKNEAVKATGERHKSLSQIFSPHLASILGPPMRDYIPSSLILDSWSPENIEGYFKVEERHEMFPDGEIRANALKLLAIISGTVYGVAAKSLIPSSSQSGGQAFIEIAFRSNVLFSPTLFRWARIIGAALGGMLEIWMWKDFIIELATGVSSTPDNQPHSLPERVANADRDVDPASSCVFGAQANGIFVVSDFIANPSTQVDNVLRFHVGSGRILNLPVDERGFLYSSHTNAPSIDFRTIAGQPTDVLRRLPPSNNPLRDQTLRVDPEPDWTSNPKTIQFSVRMGGGQIARLNINQIIWRLSHGRIMCECSEIKHQLRVPQSEGWVRDTLHSMLDASPSGSIPCSARIKNGSKVMVDVFGDEMHRLYAVGMLSSRRVAVSTSCIECAYERVMKNFQSKAHSFLMIIG